MTEKLTVVAPAMKAPDGRVFTKDGAINHVEIMRFYLKAGSWKWIRGFKLSDGTFAGRYRAAMVARDAGQIDWDPGVTLRGLYSYDLWTV